jgi:hypothetical protein
MAHHRRAVAAAATLNAGIFVAEAIAGYQASSLSLLMDSVHNLSDQLALVALWLAFILSKGPSRTLLRSANIFNSVGLTAVSGLLLWQAVERFMNPVPVQGIVPVIVGLAAAAANWGVARLLLKPSEHNAAIRLAYIHNLGDVWVSPPCTMWCGIVGFSGTGKTPGLEVTKRALAAVQREKRDDLAELRRKHNSKVEAARAARAAWKKQVEAAVENGGIPPEMPKEAQDPGKFVAPRLYVSDGTIERMGELLTARPQGIIRILDELAGMFTNMQRYSGGQDNEFWLEAWNGNSYSTERMGRQLHVDHLLVGVLGGFQPDKLVKAFAGDDDGMYARFIFAWRLGA